MILNATPEYRAVFLYLFWIMTIFQTNILFKTSKCHHGGPLGAGGPGQLPPLPPLNPALEVSSLNVKVGFLCVTHYLCVKQVFLKENVRYPVWICRDPIFSDFRDPMIIFSDSRDPIWNSRDPNRVPKMPWKKPGVKVIYA